MADALISPAVGGVMWTLSAASAVYATAKIKDDPGEKKVPLMAVAGAFVFAAQMINFTIPGTGSSGHIGGGILLAALLGAFPGLLTIAAVLVIQCLFFADGGLLALGCNIFNMGVIPALIIYPLIFKPLARKGFTVPRITAASALAVVAGLQLGAFAVVLETLVSGITALPFSVFVLLMQPIHLAIGIGEGIVTSLVLNFVYKANPEILENSAAQTIFPLRGKDVSGGAASGKTAPWGSIKKSLVLLGALALLTGGLLSIFASAYPDGLEWAIERTSGSAELEAEGPAFRRAEAIQENTAFMPDYTFPGVSAGSAGTALAGIAGAAMSFFLAGGAGFVIYLVKRNKAKAV
ncbi:MAG: energy-coupling factor ABC transporter permease [Treponema sp.]|nr:energy-coupling factor ABC transporter permease [Treponema sp.]